MLTNATVKAARPGARSFKLWDAQGLYLLVLPSGHRSWCLRSRKGGRERVFTIGGWPDVSLELARDRAAAVRAGADPVFDLDQARTFEHTARIWHALVAPEWSPEHAADVLASLERDAFPAIGALELAAITRPKVLAVVRAIEARGHRETAGRMRQRISAIFQTAMSEGWCDADPAGGELRKAMKKRGAQQHHPALTDVVEVRALQTAVEQLSASAAVKLASRFLALTAVRLAGVRGVTWSEIEELDGPAPLWRVPAARMKLKRDKKALVENDHLVPLSPAAVAVLREARSLCGGEMRARAYIFPGRGGGMLGESGIGDLYNRAGYAGRHVPHGWRSSFSTILNERLGKAEREIIDQALGHALKTEQGQSAKVEAAYNRAEHLGPRRRIFETWAQILTG